MAIVNLEFLARVDARKTNLTERTLFDTGVIASVGSVDFGATRTDTRPLERARGIASRSAVGSFRLSQRKANPTDTRGPVDFVGEVVPRLRMRHGVRHQTRRTAPAIRRQPVDALPRKHVRSARRAGTQPRSCPCTLCGR